MRTLDEIVAAARLNEPLDLGEARYAITAFDVLLAQLDLDQDVARLQKWITAATMPPRDYIGEANDPREPEAVEWYRAMHGVTAAVPSCFGRKLDAETCFNSCPARGDCYERE